MRHRLHFLGVVLKAMNKKNRIWMRHGMRGILRREAAYSRYTKDNNQGQENRSALNVDLRFHYGKLQRELNFRAAACRQLKYSIYREQDERRRTRARTAWSGGVEAISK